MTSPFRFLPAVLLALGLTGCGGTDHEVTKSLLRGKVTVENKPVTAGVVTAYKGGTKVAEANINPDGAYEFAAPPGGEYQLTVTKTDTPTPYSKPVKLPAKYADPARADRDGEQRPDERPGSGAEFEMTPGRRAARPFVPIRTV